MVPLAFIVPARAATDAGPKRARAAHLGEQRQLAQPPKLLLERAAQPAGRLRARYVERGLEPRAQRGGRVALFHPIQERLERVIDNDAGVLTLIDHAR